MHGAAKDLPVTVVENASRESQIIVATTLERLVNDIKAHGIKGPAILLLGYSPNPSIRNILTTEISPQRKTV